MSDSENVDMDEARRVMLEQIRLHTQFASDLIGVGCLSDPVMAALAAVPRHEFVPEQVRPYAYSDKPLPIACGKTVSQPFIVALMTHLLDLAPGDRVLEIGTGCGYHTAVLAELAEFVFSVEIVAELATGASGRLLALGYRNVDLRVGDGARGWPEHAPFEKIVVASAPEMIPARLLMQLGPGGRMVVPSGLEGAQQLVVVDKDAYGAITTREVLPVAFAPMVMTH